MRSFAALFNDLDQTNRSSDKLALLANYFHSVPAADAAWALFFLSERNLPRPMSTTVLRDWISEQSGVPLWLVEECYETVGDLAETIALMSVTPRETPSEFTLTQIIAERILPLKGQPLDVQRAIVGETWSELSRLETLVYNKLLTGAFRVGVAKRSVVKALSAAFEVPEEVVAHRLAGEWCMEPSRPTAEDFQRIISNTGDDAVRARPYPFFLAYPFEGALSKLGEVGDWQIEWKWDGIRGQLIRRGNDVLIWSRGDELISDSFPEIAEAARAFMDDVVLDGEILAWQGEAPLPFAALQRRIGRKRLTSKLLEETPTIFLAYDILELNGEDLRGRPQIERRLFLEEFCARHRHIRAVRISPLVGAESWHEIERARLDARERSVEGLMFKSRSAPYGVGRTRGPWWKWKVQPHFVDAVLISAQPGHGRRAGLFTDYTFGVWDGGRLVPIAKAYSGLTDQEIREVDQFVRKNTLERYGPVRTVPPELVFELAFEGIQQSSRHKSGVALRFPRMHRWRRDKLPQEADSLETLKMLIVGPQSAVP